MEDEGSAKMRPSPAALPVPERMVGSRVGRYELVVGVREDDAGSVWLAREIGGARGERLVALRFPSPSLSVDPRFRELLRQEVKGATAVTHASVAQVLELGGDADKGTLFVASEWVEGETFADLRAATNDKRVRIPLAIVLRILADACAGLHAAHLLRDRNGGLLNVVHADVSPRSLVVGKDGVARVIDLGFAKAKARHAGGANLAWSDRGRAPGHRVDRHADVWGVGAILAQTLAEAATTAGSGRDAPVPSPLEEIVARARSLEPAERFATAAEMGKTLEAAMMALGIATSHATVASFVDAHVGYKTRARADALQEARSRPPVALSIPTPAVDSFAATVHSLPNAPPTPPVLPRLPAAELPTRIDAPLRLVAPAATRVSSASAIAHTPAHGTPPASFGGRSSVAKWATIAVAAALVVGVGAKTYRVRRAPSAAASPAVVEASPPVVAVLPATCPVGTIEVANGATGAGAPAPFCLDAAPVTTEAYKACSDKGDCKRAATENRWAGITPKERAEYDPLCRERDPNAHAHEPINCVDREMASVYCAAHDARLPTEREASFVTHDVDGKARAAGPVGGASSEWSLRPNDPPTNRSYAVGFRCARSL
jgi:serine/threonine protein kinase